MNLEARPTKPKLEIPPILYAYLGGIALLAGLYLLIPGIRELVNDAFAILTSNDRSAIEARVAGFGLWGPVLVDRFVTPQISKVVEGAVERYGAWAIIALRLAPLVPSDSVSFMTGPVKMKPVPFLLTTITGVTPVMVAVAYFGSSFDRLRTLIVVVTALSLSALIGYVIYDKLKRRRAKPAS